MKKVFIILFSFMLCMTVAVRAQSPTEPVDTITPTLSPQDKEIQTFKDKVATKVAEMREKNNKAIAGTVVTSKDGTIHIKSNDDSEYDIKTDDNLTQYFQVVGNSKKEIKLDNITKGDYIIISGVLNDKIMNANVIYVDEFFLVDSGKISQVNSTDFSLQIVTSSKDSVTLNVETSTQQYLLDSKTFEIAKTGFSKIKEGDTIHFVAKKGDVRVPNDYSAVRFIVIPQEFFIK